MTIITEYILVRTKAAFTISNQLKPIQKVTFKFRRDYHPVELPKCTYTKMDKSLGPFANKNASDAQERDCHFLSFLVI